MANVTRGEFLGFGAMLAGAVSLRKVPVPIDAAQAPPAAQGGGGIEPDLVVVNGRVYTMDEAQPRAEAFAHLGVADHHPAHLGDARRLRVAASGELAAPQH